jgi:predicted ATPase
VTQRPFKIGISGTHSTGKSSFLDRLSPMLEQHGLTKKRIDGVAQRAMDLGFPILANHTYDSTLWIMAEVMRQEAEASLHNDVVLVDRPVPDALGYLLAALEVSRRTEDARRLDELRTIARAHAQDYDVFIVTSLDPGIRLGEGRDRDTALRAAAARQIDVVAGDFRPDAFRLTTSNAEELAGEIENAVLRRLDRGKKRS